MTNIVKRKLESKATPSAKKGSVPRIFAWSYSRLSDYLSCPARCKYKHIDRIPEPPNPAAARGTALHELAAKFAKASTKSRCPNELKTFEDEFRAVQKVGRGVDVEKQWAFDKEWNPVEWFAKDAWVRVVLDLLYVDLKNNVLVIVDHKSGKMRDDHEKQLSLYAVAGFIMFPDVREVHTRLWYLDSGDITEAVFERKDAPKLKRQWETSVKPMFVDTTFKAKPGNACRWCHFRKANGGPCQF